MAGTDFHCVLLSPVSLVKLTVASSKMQPLDVYSHLGQAIKMMHELAACPCKRALRVDIDTQKIVSLFRPFPVFNPVPRAPWCFTLNFLLNARQKDLTWIQGPFEALNTEHTLSLQWSSPSHLSEANPMFPRAP